MQNPSSERARIAKQSAKQSEEQGKEIEAFGKTIGTSLSRVTEAQGDTIETAGKAVQKHAVASYDYAKEADYSGEKAAFNQAASEHRKEREEVLKAAKVYSEVVQNHGHQATKPSAPDDEP
ncbi:MAG: hypothetical protein ACAF41_21885 [Leptolyngbya sp. BL-A-14]